MPRRRRNPQQIARSIERLLRQRNSPIPADRIMHWSRVYGVAPDLLTGIAGAETQFGTDPNAGDDITIGHNPFGMGPHIRYPSWDAAIKAAAKNLRENYLNQGLRDVVAIRNKWAPLSAANDPTGLNSAWVKNVRGVMEQLGGRGDAVGPGRTRFRIYKSVRDEYGW